MPKFIKSIYAHFVKNSKKRSKITLVDKKDNASSEDKKIAEILNNLFRNIIKHLNILINTEVLEGVSMIQDPI